MCELDREDRNCQKVECIFIDKNSMKIQNFFRIFKTNISKHNSVMKYQIQILHKQKWFTLENDVKPIYEYWRDEMSTCEERCKYTIERVRDITIEYNKPF